MSSVTVLTGYRTTAKGVAILAGANRLDEAYDATLSENESACYRILEHVRMWERAEKVPQPSSYSAGESNRTDSSEATSACGLASSRPCVARAYGEYEHAVKQVGKALTDAAAYEWIKLNGSPYDDDDSKLTKLPNFETWRRYLRDGRFAEGTQKKRRGRLSSPTRSMIREWE